MSEQNKAVTKRVFDEGWNARNLAVCDEVFTATHVSHDPSTGDTPPGPAGLKGVISTYTGAFPDLKMTVNDILAEGDRVVVRWTAVGTNTGTMMGMPPTGKTSTVTGMLVNRFENGKIAESWGVWDKAGMLQQLGLMPS